MNFGKRNHAPIPDLTQSLRDADTWSPRSIRRLGLNGSITALAVEPLSGLLALGTDRGSIHLFGSPAATAEIAVSGAPYRKVRFINFAQNLAKMVVLDSRNTLSVYDLSAPKRPALDATYQVPQGVKPPQLNVVALQLSDDKPVACSYGQCLVYDIDRAQVSPYAIPNVWAMRESQRGVFRPRTAANPLLVDVIIHPRDLNLLILVFDVGVIVWDIVKREPVKTFDQIVSTTPGSDEGEMRAITSMAIHPLGNAFAIGHMDGSISFWSLENGARAISTHFLPVHPSRSKSSPATAAREPVFKLAWSAFPDLEECKALLSVDPAQSKLPPFARLVGSTLDYAGGETVLSVLGGLQASDLPGVRVLQFPPMEASPPMDSVVVDAETHIRGLSRHFEPTGLEMCPTPYPVDDFILMPRSNPHFNNTHDPISILQLYKLDGVSVVSATEFPPPLAPAPIHSTQSSHSSREITPFSASLTLTPQEPARFRLPSTLFSGVDAVRGAHTMKVDRDSFSRLIREWIDVGAAEEADGSANPRPLPLRAGVARGDAESSLHSSQARPYQLLVTHHVDLSIRFYDCSTQLLTSSAPLRFEFPQLIPHLRIEIQSVLSDRSVAGLIDPRARIGIKGIHLSPNALHCAIVLTSGHVLFYAFVEKNNPVYRGADPLDDSLDDLDDEQSVLVALTDLGKRGKDGYKPLCLLDRRGGDVTAIALSDGGLHAVAYMDSSLVLLHEDKLRVLTAVETEEPAKGKKVAIDPVACLRWDTDVSYDSSAPRTLSIVRNSGVVYSMTFKLGLDDRWKTTSSVKAPLKSSIAHPLFFFSIDGNAANAGTYTALAQFDALDSPKSKVEQTRYLIVCNQKEARSFASDSKERVGKVEWKALVEYVNLVERAGSLALAAFTSDREVLVFALPTLEFSHRFHLDSGPQRLGQVCSDLTGDFTEVFASPPADYPFPITLATLFSSRRPRMPTINFGEHVWALPYQPGPPHLEGSYVAWIWGPKVYTGKEIDAILAGPDRPPPKAGAQPALVDRLTQTVEAAVGSSSGAPKSPSSGSTLSSTRPGLNQAASGDSYLDSISASASGLYGRMTSAATERGEALSGLEETFNSLESASKGMADQAKRIATVGAARWWF